MIRYGIQLMKREKALYLTRQRREIEREGGMVACSRALQFFIPCVWVSGGIYNVYRCNKIVLVSLNGYLLIECTLIRM